MHYFDLDCDPPGFHICGQRVPCAFFFDSSFGFGFLKSLKARGFFSLRATQGMLEKPFGIEVVGARDPPLMLGGGVWTQPIILQ